MESILEGFAAYCVDNLATDVLIGQKTLALRGEFNGGCAPLGSRIADNKSCPTKPRPRLSDTYLPRALPIIRQAVREQCSREIR